MNAILLNVLFALTVHASSIQPSSLCVIFDTKNYAAYNFRPLMLKYISSTDLPSTIQHPLSSSLTLRPSLIYANMFQEGHSLLLL